MITLTKFQRRALKRVYDRCPIWAKTSAETTCDSAYGVGKPLTYREFRSRVQSMLGGQGAVVIHWANMWLAIEPDGHVHS